MNENFRQILIEFYYILVKINHFTNKLEGKLVDFLEISLGE